MSEEKQLITVFEKRSRPSKEYGDLRNEKATDDYATRQVREHSLRSKLFVSHGYTKKIKKHLLSQVFLFDASEGERGKTVGDCFYEAKSTKQGEWGIQERK